MTPMERDDATVADALHALFPLGERALLENTPKPLGGGDGDQPPPPVEFNDDAKWAELIR